MIWFQVPEFRVPVYEGIERRILSFVEVWINDLFRVPKFRVPKSQVNVPCSEPAAPGTWYPALYHLQK